MGGNLGDRPANLRFAIQQLNASSSIQSLHSSSFYETSPIGPVAQEDFLNAVVEVETTLQPLALLELGLKIERTTGRDRSIRWGPRSLDVDLLAYDQCTLKTEALTLPHPEATKRAFVLVPWAELTPDFLLAGRSIADWLAEVGEQGVRKFDCR
nr:2-amino-4-hydroxy-6-hydroxymethyldihydropteridine diphosphokinase [Cerasicoccus arenae]